MRKEKWKAKKKRSGQLENYTMEEAEGRGERDGKVDNKYSEEDSGVIQMVQGKRDRRQGKAHEERGGPRRKERTERKEGVGRKRKAHEERKAHEVQKYEGRLEEESRVDDFSLPRIFAKLSCKIFFLSLFYKR